ncbi:MAG: heme A synthase [Halobacteriales archaeon]|jgi:heme A synthase
MTDSQSMDKTFGTRFSGDGEPFIPFKWLSGVTLVTTFVLMLLGAYTKAIGAGLSCPDWPTCYGTWIPFLQPEVYEDAAFTQWQIFAEWAHRGLAMVTGFLILGTAVAAWRRESIGRIGQLSAVFALGVLPVQVVLGGLTVTENLEPLIVTGHLGTAMLIFGALIVTVVAAGEG